MVCCVHWGIEYSYELEQVQKDTARAYIDAGADVIVGTHSHCLQGIEYYKGAPIFYNLGNFWFNEKDLLTCLLELHVTGTKEDWQLDATIVPAHQAGCVKVPDGRQQRLQPVGVHLCQRRYQTEWHRVREKVKTSQALRQKIPA